MIITFLPLNQKIEEQTGGNLYKIARENGIDLGGVCAGNKTCGKCKVLITKGNKKEFQQEEVCKLTQEERDSGIRLACCFEVIEDTCVILMDYHQRLRKPDLSEGTQEDEKKHPSKEQQTENLMFNKDTNNSTYGIAMDIGTTSVEVELWNRKTKIRLGNLCTNNPQSLYGADVISRITYAIQDPLHQKKLTEMIQKCCNTLIAELATSNKISLEDIDYVVLAGNTTMSHLYLGKSVESLSKVPFQGVSYTGKEIKPTEVGLGINPLGKVYMMPGIGGHVGGDTLGCILTSNLMEFTGISLMVDIGTNGEIVLAKEGNLIACSTAAGPAFEGGALYQGMRAMAGAITKVEINQTGIKVDFIGKGQDAKKPKGLCGSGAIETVSELFRNQMMDETGRLLGKAGEQNYITLWSEGEKQVIMTQKDIRELQLAKGAIYAGMMLLLKKEKILPDQVDKIYLAGNFGSNLNLKKAIHIGLLPKINENKIEYVGNGALAGAVKIMLGEISQERADSISKTVKHLDLALSADFQEEFMDALSFPVS